MSVKRVGTNEAGRREASSKNDGVQKKDQGVRAVLRHFFICFFWLADLNNMSNNGERRELYVPTWFGRPSLSRYVCMR